MPLPLLLIPIAATATSSAMSTTAVVGMAAGSTAAGGAAASLFWWFFPPAVPSSKEHIVSQKAERKMTRDRITAAHKEVEGLHPKVKAVAAEVKAATSATTKSVNVLRRATEKASQTSKTLKKVTKAAKTASDTFAASLPPLEKTVEKVYQDTEETIAKLETLNGLLATKEGAITQAHVNISTLKHTVDEQTKTLTQLTGTVEALTSENTAQKKTIEVMGKKMTHLSTEAERASRNCRFFKDVAQQALAKKGHPQPTGDSASLSL